MALRYASASMNSTVIPISAIRKRQAPKGRQVTPAALADVDALLGPGPPRRDLLVEYLHRINDRHGQLCAEHLVALAQRARLSPAEVYEVASFYHHFDVVRDGSAAPALTVRVCDGLSCEMAGARALLDKLPALLGSRVRVVAAPCVGRCEQAPAVVVHQTGGACDAAIGAVRGRRRLHTPRACAVRRPRRL